MAIIARRRTWIPADEVVDPRKRLAALLHEGISILELKAKTANALEQRGIITIEGLLMQHPSTLLEIQNFGLRTLKEIYQALRLLGFPVQESVLMAVAKKSKRAGGATATQLSHAQALRRCIQHLYSIWVTQVEELGTEHPYVMQLSYAIEFAQTRQLEPEPEVTDEA